jgi:uncharacterized OB-fold protein
MTATTARHVPHDPLTHRERFGLDGSNDFFWLGGADGVLRFWTCADCGYRSHPGGAACARCLGRDVGPQPVSGLATVLTYTVNVQQWTPGQDPYVIAIVGIDEQDDLHVTTNIVDCDPWAVRIGDRVKVVFLHRHGLHYPLFRPVTS